VTSPRAAVGFLAHTGWAAAVVVAGSRSEIRVIDRRRVALVEPPDSGSRFVYHMAAELPKAKAAGFVKKAVESAHRVALESFRALAGDVGTSCRLVASGIVTSASKLPESLDEILGSHPLLHTAEGVLYRNAIRAASEALDLPVVAVPARELPAKAAAALGTTEVALRAKLAEVGRAAGRPWAQDQRDATLVAWMALASK